jgi:N-methylhydantoinase B
LKVDGYDHEIDLHASLTIADDHCCWISPAAAGCVGKGINVPLNYATRLFGFACAASSGRTFPTTRARLRRFASPGRRGAS